MDFASLKKSNIGFIAAALLAAWPAVADNTDWPAFRGNQQRTAYINERLGFPGEQPYWKVQLNGAVISSPSIVRDVLYVGCKDSTLYALDAGSGVQLWAYKARGPFDSSPLVVRDTVIIGNRDNRIHLVDAESGDSLMTWPAGLQLSSAGITEKGEVLVGMGWQLNRFSVFPHANAANQWSVYFGQPCYSSAAHLGRRAIISGNDGVYNYLYGIHLDLKIPTWRTRVNGGGYLSTAAISSDSVVFYAPGDADRNIYALDLATGKIRWGSDGSSNGGLAKRRKVHMHNNAALYNYLFRLSPAHRQRVLKSLAAQGFKLSISMAKRRKNPAAVNSFLPEGAEVKTSSVAIDKNQVYVIQRELGYIDDLLTYISRFTLLCLDAENGKRKWQFQELRDAADLGYNSSPIIAGNMVYFGWGEGKTFGLSTKDGQKLWEDSLTGHIVSSPAIAGDKLYFATMDGYVYCFGLTQTANGVNFRQSTYCYPNPAPGKLQKMISNIQVYVERPALMQMTIYNMADKPVARVSRNMGADEKFTHLWNISKVANGIYFARIRVKYAGGGEEKKTVKIAVLK